ncbi:MFS transporter, SP family, sugar:H+ symporter [Marchantia polymorpha subsp. ruderalis]|nr:hypothetical protein MARPO_0001s0269 [Marchantia polymorpha]BBM99169.1 hypothetical protein Mp_1g19310 [Marchantia polymorpha subsp. ruderalis]|eukprot:PTQ50246.1 hypothetical protein MARPO_0001s0269 [Marchantia polymorpha]
MAGGMMVSGGGPPRKYEGRTTGYVILTCILAASGGLMFGYDVGVSGGVTSMDGFLKKFFREVYDRKHSANLNEGNYCKYDNQKLQAFTSSLYIAGLVATFFASYTSRRFGRRPTMQIASACFVIGTVLCAAAQNMAMLIFGRVLLGCGVGFANQAVPLYLSEMAPTHLRGGLNILFQLAVTVGIFFANLVNYGTEKIDPWGWRLALGLAGIPAALLAIGGVLLLETPNSLIERGQMEKGKRVLQKVRGTPNVQAEYEDMVAASEVAKSVKHPFRNIVKRRNRPQLVIAMLLQLFQQMTGINAIMFYAPVLFQTLGFKSSASLYSAVMIGCVNVLSTIVAVAIVDKVGRRKLLLQAGVQMFIAMLAIGIILGVQLKDTGGLPNGSAIVVVVLICVFVSGFAWSWGPLGWLIPSETFPLETRSAGQSITVSTNLLFTFIIAQAFLSMLCHMKYAIFLFFTAWIVIMTLFVIFFLPETKGIPIEEMQGVWGGHWFWKRYVPYDPALEQEMQAKNAADVNPQQEKIAQAI